MTPATELAGCDRAHESDHLRREHGLTKVEAWVKGPDGQDVAANHQSGSATRMAKLRARRRDAGLIYTEVPAAIVAQVRAAGGWPEWQSLIQASAVRGEYQRLASQWGMEAHALGSVLAQPSLWRRLILHLLR